MMDNTSIASSVRPYAGLRAFILSRDEDPSSGVTYYHVTFVLPGGGSGAFGDNAFTSGTGAATGGGVGSSIPSDLLTRRRLEQHSGLLGGCFAGIGSVMAATAGLSESSSRRAIANVGGVVPNVDAGVGTSIDGDAAVGSSSSSRREAGGPGVASSFQQTANINAFDAPSAPTSMEQDNNLRWRVRKRYSEFSELYDVLRFKYNLSAVSFPGRLCWSLDGRQRKLENFLNFVLELDTTSALVSTTTSTMDTTGAPSPGSSSTGTTVDPTNALPRTQVLRQFVSPPLHLQLQSWSAASMPGSRPPMSLMEQRMFSSPPALIMSGEGEASAIMGNNIVQEPSASSLSIENGEEPQESQAQANKQLLDVRTSAAEKYRRASGAAGGARTQSAQEILTATCGCGPCIPPVLGDSDGPLAIFRPDHKDLLRQRALGEDAQISATHALINAMDTQLLAYLFSFLPASTVAKTLPSVCTAFWLGTMCSSLWTGGLTYIHTHAPCEQKLSGFHRLLSHVCRPLERLHFEALVGNERLLEPLPFHIQFSNLREVHLGTQTKRGTDLISQFLEAIGDVAKLRKLTLDVPFTIALLKDLQALLLLNSFLGAAFALQELHLLFKPSVEMDAGLDFVTLEIPQEPIIDWLFKDPPAASAADEEGPTGGAMKGEGKTEMGGTSTRVGRGKSTTTTTAVGRGLGGSSSSRMQPDEDQKNIASASGTQSTKKDASTSSNPASSPTSFTFSPIPLETERLTWRDAASSSPPSSPDVEPLPLGTDATSSFIDTKKDSSPSTAKKVVEPRNIPNKDIVFAGLSMANADNYFADEFAIPEPRDKKGDKNKMAKKKPIYYVTLQKLSIALSPGFRETGLRREFRELGQNPTYFDEKVKLPYVSPILRRVHTFFPSLVEVEIDFLTENLIWCLRDPPQRGGGATFRLGGPMQERGIGRGGTIGGGGAGTRNNNNPNTSTSSQQRDEDDQQDYHDPNFPDQTFLPNIKSFTIRGNLMRIKHVKDQIFCLLLKKLGPKLESFRFLPEAELPFLDMYKGMVFGHSYANLGEELRDRRMTLKRFEVDWIYFNTNAIRAIGDHCRESLEILRLNACDHLTDESTEVLKNTLPKLEILRLRQSNGFTDLTIQHLVQWGESNQNFKLELEPSYAQSSFMLTQLKGALNYPEESGGYWPGAAVEAFVVRTLQRERERENAERQQRERAGGGQDLVVLNNGNGEPETPTTLQQMPQLPQPSRLILLQDKLDGYRNAKSNPSRSRRQRCVLENN
ncbi:unnamed protein product [Amoebophrya sp. A25]|nr:unnamed protein product [Amoebophrya sp. A25]|eukprot:GSA25T00026848001.1